MQHLINKPNHSLKIRSSCVNVKKSLTWFSLSSLFSNLLLVLIACLRIFFLLNLVVVCIFEWIIMHNNIILLIIIYFYYRHEWLVSTLWLLLLFDLKDSIRLIHWFSHRALITFTVVILNGKNSLAAKLWTHSNKYANTHYCSPIRFLFGV